MSMASHNGHNYDLTRRITTNWAGLGKTNDVRDMAAADDNSGKSHMDYSMGEINRKTRNMLRHQYTNYDHIIPQDRNAAPEVQVFRNVVKRQINKMIFERWPGLDNDSDTRWIQPIAMNGGQADNAPKVKALDYDTPRGELLAALATKTRDLADSLVRPETVDDFIALGEMLRGFEEIAAMAKELGFREKKPPAIEPAHETQPPAAVSDSDVLYVGNKSAGEVRAIIASYLELGQLTRVGEKFGVDRLTVKNYLQKNNIVVIPNVAIDPDTGKEMWIGNSTIGEVKEFYRNLDKMKVEDAATLMGVSHPTAYKFRKMRDKCPN